MLNILYISVSEQCNQELDNGISDVDNISMIYIHYKEYQWCLN